jgi:ornithine cyclodeaminase/alanine dehydrogenase-like protein (mu-crystallin family)
VKILNEQETRRATPFPALIDAIAAMFVSGCEMPLRHHHSVAMPAEPDATLLLMPAWQAGGYIGVKIATVFPGNSGRGEPAINGSYMLFSARDGKPVALIDGAELTARRTAAASALAARYLAREDASHLVMAGTGRLALNLIAAHATVRPIRNVTIWGRDPEKAAKVAAGAAALGFNASHADDLSRALRHADIVSCATLAAAPLVLGEWLRPGIHVDLVGAFKPDMRESDDEAIRKASVFVDTMAGATTEAGDIVQALNSGALERSAIRADLAQLCRGEHTGRSCAAEITLFKSVGAALEDLAGAVLAIQTVSGANLQAGNL